MGQEQSPVFALIPAAGAGKRMGAEVPKQYLPLLGKPILEHTLARFVGSEKIKRVVVTVAADDDMFPRLCPSLLEQCTIITGGAERCDSVIAGLDHLRKSEPDDSWVLVHDAARPCIQQHDIDKLIQVLVGNRVGGLLAAPVSDTIKDCSQDGLIRKTIDRTSLWRALTPQMFRLGLLQEALAVSIKNGLVVTDESQAIENAGFSSKIVEGSNDNIKVTRPEDIWLAEAILTRHKVLQGDMDR